MRNNGTPVSALALKYGGGFPLKKIALVDVADIGFKPKLCGFMGIDRSSPYKPRTQAVLDDELAEQIREVLVEDSF